MSYQVLARKWRPGKFSEVVGQQHAVRALQNALRLGRLHHAYLFAGTRGVGKTTLARIFAKCLNCEAGPVEEPCGECSACKAVEQGGFVDLIEVDAASRTGVDDMRELLESSQFVPTIGKFKVYLIDEVHMLSTSSFNALLKTLEEPPEHVKFFFATTHPDKLPLTILSRCLQFNLVRLIPDEISAYLTVLLEQEKISFDEQAVRQIALCAEGSMRDALSLLDQAIAYGDGRLKAEEVEAMLGLTARSHVTQLLKLVFQEDLSLLIDKIVSLHAMAVDFELLLADIITLLQEVAVYQAVLKPHPSARFKTEEVSELADEMMPEDVQLFYQIALKGKQDLSFLPDLRAGFEMIMLRMSVFKPLDSESHSSAVVRSSNRTAATRSDTLKSAASSGAPPAAADLNSARPGSDQPAAARSDTLKSAADSLSAAADSDDDKSLLEDATPAESETQNQQLADLTDLEHWCVLIERLNIGGAAKEVCNHCVVEIDAAGKIRLVSNKQDESLITSDAANEISRAFSEHFRGDITVRIEVSDTPRQVPQQIYEQKETEYMREKKQEIEQHPSVKSMQEDLDASIESLAVNPEPE